MKNIAFLEKIKKYIKELEENRLKQKEEKKQHVLEVLSRQWTDSEIEIYNCKLIADSAGWIGGNYTEYDIKKSILNSNIELFTEEEIISLIENMKTTTKSV